MFNTKHNHSYYWFKNNCSCKIINKGRKDEIRMDSSAFALDLSKIMACEKSFHLFSFSEIAIITRLKLEIKNPSANRLIKQSVYGRLYSLHKTIHGNDRYFIYDISRLSGISVIKIGTIPTIGMMNIGEK